MISKVWKWVLVGVVISGALQASECQIDYMGAGEKNNVMQYKVNGESLVVTLDRGIVYRIFAYEEGNKENSFKEAFVGSSKMCFGAGSAKCIALPSQEEGVVVDTFLRNSFCKDMK